MRRSIVLAQFVKIVAMTCCGLWPTVLPAADTRPVIVAFGDSLTAGYGLANGESFPDSLQKLIDQRGLRYRVVNQGISGDTTSGGVARVNQALQLKPAIVILELGANDGLRGLPLTTTRSNLSGMIDQFRKAGAKVLVAGITLPRNYGPDYIQGFDKIYRDLAREKHVPLIPFLLEGVATNPKLMQEDGLHPTAEGARRVAATVMRYLQPLLVQGRAALQRRVGSPEPARMLIQGRAALQRRVGSPEPAIRSG